MTVGESPNASGDYRHLPDCLIRSGRIEGRGLFEHRPTIGNVGRGHTYSAPNRVIQRFKSFRFHCPFQRGAQRRYCSGTDFPRVGISYSSSSVSLAPMKHRSFSLRCLPTHLSPVARHTNQFHRVVANPFGFWCRRHRFESCWNYAEDYRESAVLPAPRKTNPLRRLSGSPSRRDRIIRPPRCGTRGRGDMWRESRASSKRSPVECSGHDRLWPNGKAYGVAYRVHGQTRYGSNPAHLHRGSSPCSRISPEYVRTINCSPSLQTRNSEQRVSGEIVFRPLEGSPRCLT